MLWVGWALALILLWALASYDPADPGFASTGSGRGINNAAGPAGAWISSFLYVLFGHAAYLFPVLLAAGGWLVVKSRKASGLPAGRDLGLRVGGFVVTLAASCGLATLHFADNGLPETAGGIVGQLAGLGLSTYLSFLGATLLLLALWLAGVSMFSGMSWLAVMDRVGGLTLAGVGAVQRGVGGLRDRLAGRKAAQARQESVERKKQSTVRKAPPRIEPVLAPAEKSERVEKERQVPLFETPSPGEIPPLGLLDEAPPKVGGYSEEALEAMSRLVELKLRDFGVEVEVVAVHPGPVVTRFELAPAPGVKVSQISNLAKDLARALSAIAVRVVEVIPGKPTVGLEIPNETRELVTLGEILAARAYDEMKSPLALALGKDIGGQPVYVDLARMPHLLVAGATGSGKSVALNVMLTSILAKKTPEEVRMLMIDPKVVELQVFDGIPHMLLPVVTDMKKASLALRWAVDEMERRYQMFADAGARNIDTYNRRVDRVLRGDLSIEKFMPKRKGKVSAQDAKGHEILLDPADGEAPDAENFEPEKLPSVVVVVDEFADLMMVAAKDVEACIARLAQKARAAGIHVILATQRPSVDVITGMIKANFPARIAFKVSQRQDSMTILGRSGAEHLLGMGDMLMIPPGASDLQRVHAAYVSEDEVKAVCDYLREQGDPEYQEEILKPRDDDGFQSDSDDPLYDKAVAVAVRRPDGTYSISHVQRQLGVGYNKAAKLVERMEQEGVVGPPSSKAGGRREVLVSPT